ncbi:VOC family protein [Microlunatus parietis]|uniref:Catechol 2,3-dioxygenase-like lactoylglutathione lyase family enzyme n=1 Tax=Microlunatus parietis TaxID=682979 RepID=A0A7Y9IF16_9ACTN|nr:VOC family protein [Microlunatus parietis]NYE75639.1 catechol 2,3-dioxygenase-like lactoylglutathione lyase family enzyme [Microlunatus parietis]
MGLGLRRIRHVKLPVTDLARSVAWYRSLLELDLVAEFAEDGELRGVQLVDPDGAFGIALRERAHSASRPDLTGFDPFALEAESLAALHALAARCDGLGVAHGGVQDRGEWGANLDVTDPDGTVLRFLAGNVLEPGTFHGFDLHSDGTIALNPGPRLEI